MNTRDCVEMIEGMEDYFPDTVPVRDIAKHVAMLDAELRGAILQLREALMLIPNAEDRAALALYTNELESRL